MLDFSKHPRFKLSDWPTPLQKMERLTQSLRDEAGEVVTANVPTIWLKRDDLTHLACGGNKTRKLEFLVGEALAQGATHLITEGGWQSNHCRQTAAAARQAGLGCELVMNFKGDRPTVQGNLLLDCLFGATCHLVTDGKKRKSRMADAAEKLEAAGAKPYLIPTGGSNAVGTVGYVEAMQELKGQLDAQEVALERVYCAWGSGGTYAGLTLGAAVMGMADKNGQLPVKSALVVPVNDPANGDQEGIDDSLPIIAATCEHLGIENPVEPSRMQCTASQIGPGYGQPTQACLHAIQRLAHTEGILLDPVYSAKAFAAMLDDIQQKHFTAEDHIVFVHTGGSPVLFDRVNDLAPILQTKMTLTQ